MTLRLSRTGLAVDGASAAHRLAGFGDAVLRGIGQVLLQGNAWSGLLFLLGLAVASPLAALAALAGSSASTLAALRLGAGRDQIEAGLYGFNGALVGVALLAFAPPQPAVWLWIVAAAAGSSLVHLALQDLLRPWRLPVLTAPFVLTTWCVLLAAPMAGPPWFGASPVPAGGPLTAQALLDGVLNGLAQVFLQENPATGAIFAAGLLAGAPRALAAGLAGSLIGLAVAWALGASLPALQTGLYGYNGVLVAIGFACVFGGDRARSLWWTLSATAAAPIAHAALSTWAAQAGLPALTLPFVVVAWVFLLARPGRARPGLGPAMTPPGPAGRKP